MSNALSPLMKDAIRTGQGDRPVECGDKTFDALVRRGLVNPHVGNLTQRGRVVLAQLDAQAAREVEEAVAVGIAQNEKRAAAVEPVAITEQPQDGYVLEMLTTRRKTEWGVWLSEDRFTIHADAPGSPTLDVWFVNGTDGYVVERELREHGWQLTGDFRYDDQRGITTGRVKKLTPAFPTPVPVREDVTYQIQVSSNDGETWRGLAMPSFHRKEAAQAAVLSYQVRFPQSLLRVIEIRETWTVVE